MKFLKEIYKIVVEEVRDQDMIQWNPPAQKPKLPPRQPAGQKAEQPPAKQQQKGITNVPSAARPVVGDLVVVARDGVNMPTIVTGIQGKEILLKDARTLKPFGKVDITRIGKGRPHTKYTRGQMLKFLKIPGNVEDPQAPVNVFNTAQ